MSSVSFSRGVSDYVIQMNRIRIDASRQAEQRQARLEQYRQEVTDSLLADRLQVVQQMLKAGDVEFRTGLVLNTLA